MTSIRRTAGLGIMLLAAGIMSLATGCASGGYKLTRKYSGFVNKQNIVLRIVLYILTGIVFVVTMFIDMIIFNTMDFWDGRVSQGTYNFEKDGMKYAAHHSYLEDGRRQSHLEAFDAEQKKVQDLRFLETAQGDIEVYVNGKLKGRVADISAVPQLTLFNAKGEQVETRSLFSDLTWLAKY